MSMSFAAAGREVLGYLEAAMHPSKTEDCVRKAVALIHDGAEISISNTRGNILMNAAFAGLTEVVGAAIGRLFCFAPFSAMSNAQNSNGSTALMFAANNGHSDIVALLLASGADADLTDKLGSTAADRARKNGHSAAVSILDDPRCEAVRTASVQVSIYRLFAMCHLRHSQTMSLVAESGAWLSGLDKAVLNGTALFRGSQSTAMNVAIIQRNAEMIDVLISANSDARNTTYKISYFNVEANLVFCLLFSMLRRSDPEDPRVLRRIFRSLKLGAPEVNTKIRVESNSALSQVIPGSVEISPLALTLCMFQPHRGNARLTSSSAILFLQLLIEAGADVNEIVVTRQNSKTQEWRVICFFCKYLFIFIKAEYKAGLSTAQRQRIKASVQADVVVIFRMLVAAGAAANASLALPEMSLVGCLAEIILPAFVTAEGFSGNYHKVFFEDWQDHFLDILKLSVQAGGDLNEAIPCEGFQMPFFLVASTEAADGGSFLRFFIKAGLTIDKKIKRVDTGEEMSFLFILLANPNFKHHVFQMMIEAGANVNETFSYQEHGVTSTSLLLQPVTVGRVELVSMLIAARADVNLFSRCAPSSRNKIKGGLLSFSPLSRAIQMGHEAVAQLLIDARADVNASINYFDGFHSICHFAVECKQSAVIRLLIRAGCDVNCVSKFLGLQETPLGIAIRKGDVDMVNILLEADAGVNYVLSVDIRGCMDYNALECVQKTLEELKSPILTYDFVRAGRNKVRVAKDDATIAAEKEHRGNLVKRLITIRSILQLHSMRSKRGSSSNVYDLEVRSAHGDGSFNFNLEVDDGSQCISDVKKRIQSHALHSCHIEFLVVPSRLVLVCKGCIAKDECKVSDVFVRNMKSNVTVLAIASSKFDSIPDFKILHDIEESRRYVTVQKLLRELQKQISEAKTNGDDEKCKCLETRSLQIQLDNPAPSCVRRDRHLHTTGNRSIQAKIQGLFENGQLEEARQLQFEIIENCKKFQNIPELARSLMTLSEILRAQGKLLDAKVACAESFETCKQLYGGDHRDTLQSMGFYAGILIEMRSINEAETLLASWQAASKQLLGDKHHYSIACKHALQCFRRAREDIRSSRYSTVPPQLLQQQSTSGELHRESGSDASLSSMEETVAQLCGSTFDRLHVLQCLVAANSNIESAKDYLANGLPANMQSQFVYGHLISKMWTQACFKFSSSADNEYAARSEQTSFDAPRAAGTVASLSFDQNTQWVCELGIVRPRFVHYSSQCPKGNELNASPHLKQGCFVCSRRSPVSGLECGQCCPYGICTSCVARLQTSHASPVLNHDFPIHGVSVSFLKSFKDRWGSLYAKWSTSQVVKMIIRPLTCTSKQSVCDDLISWQSAEVGQATVFLSHVWGQSFADTLDAFLEVAASWDSSEKDGTFVWMDVFSASQHALPGELPSTWWMNAFKQAISKMGRLVMVMQPWEKPVALSRGWCILEVFSCVSCGGRFEVALPPSERARFFSSNTSSRATFFKNLPYLMNSRQAQFSREEDKSQIQSDIESCVGYAALDSTLLRSVEAWFIPQFQLIAASAAAFFDSGDMQADAFFQLAYLYYLRGNYAAALEAGEHTMELLQSIKTFSSTFKSLSNYRRISIQTQILILNSLHMQGKFSQVRLRHFFLMHSLRADVEDTGDMSLYELHQMKPNDAHFYSTQNDELCKIYLEYLKEADSPESECRTCRPPRGMPDLSTEVAWHVVYPYCALGIPAEITTAEDASPAWAVAQELREVQCAAISSAAAAALEAEPFLKNLAFRLLCTVKSFSDAIQHVSPVSIIMCSVWPRQEKGSWWTPGDWHIFTPMSDICLHRWDAAVFRQVFQLKDLFGMMDQTPPKEHLQGSSMPTNATDVIDSLSDLFDENDKVIDIPSSNKDIVSAAENGFEDVVRALLKGKASVDANAYSDDARTPLHAATSSGHDGIVRLLVEHKAEVNALNHKIASPLEMACTLGHLSIALYLIDAKADVNQCSTRFGLAFTPIHCAFLGNVFKENVSSHEIVTLLIEAKADVNAQMMSFVKCDKPNDRVRPEIPSTALKAVSAMHVEEQACKSMSLKEIMKGFQKRILEFNDAHSHVFDIAAARRSNAPVKIQCASLQEDFRQHGFRDNVEPEVSVFMKSIADDILSRCAENSGKLFSGKISMLHFAVIANSKELCCALIDAKADPNSSASICMTPPFNVEVAACSPLNISVMCDRVDIVEMLLSAKADPNASLVLKVGIDEKNSRGFPFSNDLFAMFKRSDRVADLLKHAKVGPVSSPNCRQDDFEKLFENNYLKNLLVAVLLSDCFFQEEGDLATLKKCLDADGYKKVLTSMESVSKYFGYR